MGDPNNSSFNTQSFQQENPQFQSEYEKKVINMTNFWFEICERDKHTESGRFCVNIP